MAKQNDLGTSPATERESAPVQYINPRNKRTGQFGSNGYPISRKWPDVRGGVCEYCGVIDQNQPSQYQYKLCPHYRGMELACDYCGGKRNHDDNAYHATLLVHDHPENPDLLVVRCNAYDCVKAHEARFRVGS